jgi:hypothetical protein
MVAVLASEDERWREDQRSTVPAPVSVSEEDRRSSAQAKKAVANRPGRSLRPGEGELRREAAAGSVDDDVHVVRRPGAAGAEALTGNAGRRVRRQSGRGADLKDPGLGSAGVAPERDHAQAAVGADRDRSAGGRAGEAGRTTRLRIRSDRHPAWTGHANQREPSADRQRSRRRGAQRDPGLAQCSPHATRRCAGRHIRSWSKPTATARPTGPPSHLDYGQPKLPSPAGEILVQEMRDLHEERGYFERAESSRDSPGRRHDPAWVNVALWRKCDNRQASGGAEGGR